MKLYRIYTEDKGIPKLRQEIEAIVSAHFDGYTIFDGAVGYWKGARENSLVIEVLTGRPDLVTYVAKTIKKVNKQEAVLVIELEAREVVD